MIKIFKRFFTLISYIFSRIFLINLKMYKTFVKYMLLKEQKKIHKDSRERYQTLFEKETNKKQEYNREQHKNLLENGKRLAEYREKYHKKHQERDCYNHQPLGYPFNQADTKIIFLEKVLET